ncbi:hypothetical protein [Streptomyces anulatus]|uniref:hypothetical protein n=1 Tax=Streptomyces anulatus TaxID=1892 RepID=UPI003423418E
MRKLFVPASALVFALFSLTACGEGGEKIDRSPLPVIAAPPYICEYIPLRAVELATGVRDPLTSGHFDLELAGGLGSGSCAVYQRDDERLKILQVSLSPGGYAGKVEEQIRDGASPLPEIAAGAVGFYFKDKNSDSDAAYATLVRGETDITIQLEIGVNGRDNAADVAALMKLIAPKLITDASASSVSPSPKTPSPSPEKS